MRVFRLQLLGVLEDGLGVLLRNLLAMAPRVLDLLDLLDRLELDEQDDRVDLVVVEPLHGLQVDVEDAVLVLETILHQIKITNGIRRRRRRRRR